MKKITTAFKNIGFLLVMLFAITACDSSDGPLEEAGQSVDEAATDMGNAMEDTCEDAKEGMGAKDTDC
ncbi:hypothetical protein [Zhongshania sp.]|jgi:hypothetical protein|uniref:hypothetical protein n=1 Tax=Zhongshania sp. TaxID=1971902 RepID=UPI002A80D0FB|nr:hypothetical protein [Zhongshania sp.]